MRKISLNKLAEELGLSKTTVSMVLNGQGYKHKINVDTQNRVIDFAKKYNYRPNQIARNLSIGKTMTLGLIIPNISDSFYSTIAYHFEDKASEKNYKVLLGSSREDNKKEIELLQTFEDHQVDGLLIASTQHNLATIQNMFDQGLPLVLFDRNYAGANLPTVQFDNYGGMELLVKHMHQLGRKNLGYLGVDLDLTPLHRRRKGYEETYRDVFGKEPFTKIIRYKHYREDCVGAVNEMIEKKLDAIIFETQYLTLHGIRQIHDRGLKYPEDISIASFGDHEIFRILKPNVTAIDLQAAHIVDTAVQMLFDLIEKKNKIRNLLEIIPPELVVRD